MKDIHSTAKRQSFNQLQTTLPFSSKCKFLIFN